MHNSPESSHANPCEIIIADLERLSVGTHRRHLDCLAQRFFDELAGGPGVNLADGSRTTNALPTLASLERAHCQTVELHKPAGWQSTVGGRRVARRACMSRHKQQLDGKKAAAGAEDLISVMRTGYAQHRSYVYSTVATATSSSFCSRASA